MTTSNGSAEGAEAPADGHAKSGGSWWAWLFGFFLVAGLLAFQLFVDFRGLSEAKGMEQAVVARELARGEGFSTRIIDPLTVMRAGEGRRGEEGGDELPSLQRMRATGIGPLQVLVNAALLKVCGWDYPVDARQRIYFPDRLIAALASLFFLAAVAVTFGLVRRMFDATLATATALVLLLSDLLWRYSLSGLPQMLALLLMTLALVALARAVAAEYEKRNPLAALIVAGVACGLLILALPLAASVVVGLAVFVVIFFRRRMRQAGVFVAAALVVVAPWCLRNATLDGGGVGGPLGIAEARLISEPGIVGESRVLASFDANDSALVRVQPVKKLSRQLGVLLGSVWTFTGGAVAALLFFVSLLHPFRSPVVAAFRWALLSAWLAACVGMALAGIDPSKPVDSAALHVLFLPMFSAYGLAFLSVLWNRLPLARDRFSLWRHAHLIVIVLLSAAPLLLAVPGRLMLAERLGGRLVHWPPFDAYTVSKIDEWTGEEAVFASDLPESVAWYADRTVLRLPATPKACAELFERARAEGLHPAGLYLSPVAVDGRWISDIMRGEYEPWAPLLLRSESPGQAADLLDDFGFRHWLNLSPSANQRAWLVCDRAYWRR